MRLPRASARATKALDQTCVTGEDDTEELAGVEFLAGQDTQLAEDGSQRPWASSISGPGG